MPAHNHQRADITYRFYLDKNRDWAVASKDPFFAVTFGGKSYVSYSDDHNEGLDLPATFDPGQPITVWTDRFPGRPITLPKDMSVSEYQRLVKARIAAAATWRNHSLIFRP